MMVSFRLALSDHTGSFSSQIAASRPSDRGVSNLEEREHRNGTRARPHTFGIIRPRHSTPAPSLQMPHFMAPSCIQLADQEDTTRRLKKRANIFLTAGSARSSCWGKRLAHWKTK